MRTNDDVAKLGIGIIKTRIDISFSIDRKEIFHFDSCRFNKDKNILKKIWKVVIKQKVIL